MKRSLYVRLLVTYLATLALALVGLGGVLSWTAMRNSYSNQSHTMTIAAKQLARMSARSYFINGRISSTLKEDLVSSAKEYRANIWLVDVNGGVVQLEGNAIHADITKIDSQRMYDSMLYMLENETPVEFMGDFGGAFSDTMLTVGVPACDASGKMVGAVYMHSSVHAARKASAQVRRQIAWMALMWTAVGAIAIAIVTERVTRPLRQMSGAVSEFARGKFDQRIPVRNRDEVGRLAENLNAMAEDLSHLDQLRTGFVANVSHELRSPLTSIRGFIQGMRDGTVPPEQRDDYLDIVLSETKRLNLLINDLLDLSKMDSDQFPLKIERFDLNEKIRRVLIRYIGRIDEKGLAVEADLSEDACFVDADPQRMDQVLSNLIDNAIKFTPEGGTLFLSAVRQDKKAVCTVRDTGIGLTQEQLPFVFERFYKADSAHTPGRGTGLGLAIVKSIIEQHGESITVDSREGEGTAFTFTLPLSAGHSAERPKAIESEA